MYLYTITYLNKDKKLESKNSKATDMLQAVSDFTTNNQESKIRSCLEVGELVQEETLKKH